MDCTSWAKEYSLMSNVDEQSEAGSPADLAVVSAVALNALKPQHRFLLHLCVAASEVALGAEGEAVSVTAVEGLEVGVAASVVVVVADVVVSVATVVDLVVIVVVVADLVATVVASVEVTVALAVVTVAGLAATEVEVEVEALVATVEEVASGADMVLAGGIAASGVEEAVASGEVGTTLVVAEASGILSWLFPEKL